jgi:hypothetical protein
MKTPDQDPIARLRNADPMNRRPPDDSSSPAAARVFERIGTPEVLQASPPRDPRFRASRALPVLAVAAAIVAVVGLSLPRNAPGPVRAALGAEPASADRAKLIQVAEHQEANAPEEDPERVAKQQEFLDGLDPYPHDPTSAEVLAWLDANCDEVNASTEEAGIPMDFDCVLAAAPTVINEAPAAVAADVLRALATLDVGLPTHAQRCPDWESVDPAWRGKVEEAESHFIWIKRNGTLLVMSAVLDEDRTLPGGDGDPLTKAEKEIRDQIEAELGNQRVSTSLSPASAESEVYVQCQPPSPSAGPNAVTTVEQAMMAYAETHGDGCSLGEVERLGLVAIDFAQACQTGVPQEEPELEAPSCDDGGVVTDLETFPAEDPETGETIPHEAGGASWTCEYPSDVTTTSVGG